MCGRFTLVSPADVLKEWFNATSAPSWDPSWNVAPTRDVPVLRLDGDERRSLDLLRWGLVPSWADDESIGNRMINARSETAAEKPSFRAAFKRRRCLVPADGFYEWRKTGNGKQPHYIRRRSGDDPLAFAGLWEHWESPQAAVESFTILTTRANDLLQPVHDRMPVILEPDAWETWLDHDDHDREILEGLLRPAPEDLLEHFPVSTHVNTPRNDDERCIEPVEDDDAPPGTADSARPDDGDDDRQATLF